MPIPYEAAILKCHGDRILFHFCCSLYLQLSVNLVEKVCDFLKVPSFIFSFNIAG